MWNTTLIFSNKIHDLQKKKLEKKFFYCRLCKNYWITYCTHIMSHEIWVDEITDVTQQTFVLMKTSWRRLEVTHTSSEDAFKTSSRRLAKTSSRYLEDTFKTFSKGLQDVFKTSSRRLTKTFSRRLQNDFKTSSRRLHWVNLFLLTRFQDVFETLPKRF